LAGRDRVFSVPVILVIVFREPNKIARLLDEREQRVKEIHRLLKEQGKSIISKAFDPT
jgi:hypothetical protein